MSKPQSFSNSGFFCLSLWGVFLICTSDLSISLLIIHSEVRSHRFMCTHKMSSLCLLAERVTSVLFSFSVPGDRSPCTCHWDLCRSWKTEVQNSRKCLSSPGNYFNTFGHYNVPCIFCGCTGFFERQFMPPSGSKCWVFYS